MKTSPAAVLLVGVLFLTAAPAHAGHRFVANAEAVGAAITLLGQTLKSSATDARVTSGASPQGCDGAVNACARAAGLSEPFGSTVRANAPGQHGPRTQTGFALDQRRGPPLSKALSAGVGDATVVTAPLPNPKAKASTQDTALSVNLSMSTPAVRQQMRTGLPALADMLDTAGVDPALRELAAGLRAFAAGPADQVIAKITTGRSTAESASDESATTATAFARGSTVLIGPAPGVLVVEVGEARARASTDGTTSAATFTPATAVVRSMLPGDPAQTTVAPGQSRCFARATPLETCVTVSSGARRTAGTGAAASTAGVRISTLRAAGQGILNLEFARTSVGVTAASGQQLPRAATAVPVAAHPSTPPRSALTPFLTPARRH